MLRKKTEDQSEFLKDIDKITFISNKQILIETFDSVAAHEIIYELKKWVQRVFNDPDRLIRMIGAENRQTLKIVAEPSKENNCQIEVGITSEHNLRIILAHFFDKGYYNDAKHRELKRELGKLASISPISIQPEKQKLLKQNITTELSENNNNNPTNLNKLLR